MKTVIILLSLISYTVSVTMVTLTSEKKAASAKTYLDLANVWAQCPFNGAMKNFKVMSDSGKYYYEFVCYSAQVAEDEQDFSVLKKSFKSSSIPLKNGCDPSLSNLNVEVLCPVDYAINAVAILSTNDDKACTLAYKCVDVKPKTETKLTLSSNPVTVSSSDGLKSIDPLTKLTCGSVASEMINENSGYGGDPLRGFRLDVTGSSVSCKYATLSLKQVDVMKSNYLTNSKQLRETNDQKR